MKRSFLFLILLAGALLAGAVEISTQPSSASSPSSGSRTIPLPAPLIPGSRSFSAPLASDLPEEYDPSEFPIWAHDLSRFSIITVGAFPITFLFSSLIYDYAVYAASNFNASKSPGSQRGNQDILIMLGSAAGAALVIAAVDLLITTGRRNKARKIREQTDLLRPAP